MSILNYLHIPGITGTLPDGFDVENFEAFQGSQARLSTDGGDGGLTPIRPPETPISKDSEIAESLWEAQNAIINVESGYLDELVAMLQQKREALPKQSNIKEIIAEEFIESAVGGLAGWLTTYFTLSPVAGAVVGFLAEGVTAVAIDYLKKLYDDSIQFCEKIKDENDAILDLEMSQEHYDRRHQILRLHTEQIENLLLHIGLLEEQIQNTLNFDTKEIVQGLTDLQFNDQEIEIDKYGGRVLLQGRAREML